MTPLLKICIDGEPIAQSRHRDTIRGGKRFKYDPLSEKKKTMRQMLLLKLGGQTFKPNCFYIVGINFFFTPKEDMHQWFYPPCVNNKDFDNLAKYICDLLKEITFPDDRYITTAICHKEYDGRPRTEITIKEFPMPIIDKDTNKILKLFSPTDYQELKDHVEKILPYNPETHPLLHAEAWAQDTAQIIKEIADKFAEKLVKIKKLKHNKENSKTTMSPCEI